MTAQQQLAEYLADDAEARELGAPLYYMRAVKILRDHGPAIAELIEAAKTSVAASKSMDATGLERYRAQYSLEYHLAKLTGDALPQHSAN